MEVNDSILDYVKIIAYKYCLDSDLSGDDGKEVNELKREEMMGAIIEMDFSPIYEEVCNEHKDGHDIYINNVSIQSTIRKMGLDSDKLWCAVLFVYCLVDSSFEFVSRKNLPTIRKNAKRLLAKFDWQTSSIRVKDKNGVKYEVKDKEFNVVFQKFLEGICNSENSEYDAPTYPLKNDEDFSTAKLQYFKEILYYLLEKLYTPTQPGKITFIAQLAMTLKMFKPTKGALDVDIDGYVYKKAKTKMIGEGKIGGKEYYKQKEELDTLLLNKIKNNRIKPNTGGKFYYNR